MIRRGLQISLAGLVLLGAAPLLYAQAGSTNWPTSVTLQGFAESDLNGYYSLVGELGNDGTRIFQRYSSGGSSPAWWVTLSDVIANNTVVCGIHTDYPTTSTDTRVYLSPVTGPNWPSSFGSFIGGAPANAVAILSWEVVGSDPYEEAFPDWESAAEKIPLGFSLSMMFWGVAVASSIAMRWVKELSSAAS